MANLDVTRAVAGNGFYYAPDPSSQQVCTIGGNVAENSGGAHCLKHGFTAHHVTGLTLVLPDGEIAELGGKALDPEGPDLLGLVVGSEGTLGIATRITLRIERAPEIVRTLLAGFAATDAAGAVSGIVAAGILPSAMEMMDRLTIEAAELAVSRSYPAGAGAVLLVELDGVAVQVEEDAAEVERICGAAGAFEIRTASDDAARALLWRGRKSAFAAMGRVATDYYVQDGVVPRTRLPEVLRRIEALDLAWAPRGERLPRGGRQPAPPRPLRRRCGRDRAGARPRRGDPRGLPGRGRIADRRARRGHGQGLLHAEDVLRARPRSLRARPGAHSIRRGSATRARSTPTPRLCGEVPRALPPARAREDGRCRASLAWSRPRRCSPRPTRRGGASG